MVNVVATPSLVAHETDVRAQPQGARAIVQHRVDERLWRHERLADVSEPAVFEDAEAAVGIVMRGHPHTTLPILGQARHEPRGEAVG